MIAELARAAAAELRAIALDLDAINARLSRVADCLKQPRLVTPEYLDATTAAFHAFNALKACETLAGRLDPPQPPAAQPVPPEAA